MANRKKRRVKQRSRAHQKWVKGKKKVVKHARRRARSGAKRRRAKKKGSR
jgi:hypothetical protein